MEEEWRQIDGYDGVYEVSSFGRVRSNNTYRHNEPHILAQSKRSDGYKMVCLSKNNVARNYVVHRLVAKAFLENKDNLEMVNHKDENKENNCVDNLEWCTRSYNQLYSLKLHPERKKVFASNFIDKETGKRKSPMLKSVARTRTEPIVLLSEKGEILERYTDSIDAQNRMSIMAYSIYDVCQRNKPKEKKTHKYYIARKKGYIFCFDNADDIENVRAKLNA